MKTLICRCAKCGSRLPCVMVAEDFYNRFVGQIETMQYFVCLSCWDGSRIVEWACCEGCGLPVFDGRRRHSFCEVKRENQG